MGTANPALADAWPEDAVEVARVLGAWGIQGGLKLKAYAADAQALFSSKRWHLAAPEVGAQLQAAAWRPGAAPRPSFPMLLRVIQAREQGDSIVATVRDLEDRDAAEALKGARVFVSRASFPSLDEDEFYWIDLIGMSVFNRQGLALGEVIGLIETGPHCVLRIQRPLAAENEIGAALVQASTADSEVLIPFVSVFVDTVDKAAKRISVDWEEAD